MKYCNRCKHRQKYLTRYYPSKCPKCGHKWQSEPLISHKYSIAFLIIGQSTIILWPKPEMMYTTRNSQLMRIYIARQSKKLGWTVEVIRHIAGLKVTRLS
jgi:hypothetical protein